MTLENQIIALTDFHRQGFAGGASTTSVAGGLGVGHGASGNNSSSSSNGAGATEGKSSKGGKDKDGKEKDGLAREMEKLMEEKR